MAPMTILATAQLPNEPASWLPIVLMIIIAVGFAVGNLILSIWIGPRSDNPAKQVPYESGMMPIGDARRRFNVRFYVVAMIFLVFDVEIVFFYPWAVRFSDEVVRHSELATTMLISMGIFVAILL